MRPLTLIVAAGAVLTALTTLLLSDGGNARAPTDVAKPPPAASEGAEGSNLPQVAPLEKRPPPPSGVDAAVLQPFAGTWRITAGSVTLECDGQEDRRIEPAGRDMTMEMTPEGYLQVRTDQCATLYRVSGSQARALPDQNCTKEEDGKRSVTEVVTATLSLTDAGAAAQLHSKTTLTVQDKVVRCTSRGAIELSRKG